MKKEVRVLAIWMVAFACLDIALLSFQTFIYAVYLPKKMATIVALLLWMV